MLNSCLAYFSVFYVVSLPSTLFICICMPIHRDCTILSKKSSRQYSIVTHFSISSNYDNDVKVYYTCPHSSTSSLRQTFFNNRRQVSEYEVIVTSFYFLLYAIISSTFFPKSGETRLKTPICRFWMNSFAAPKCPAMFFTVEALSSSDSISHNLRG